MQPHLMASTLALLPPTLRELTLSGRCPGQLLAALRRFPHLRRLHIHGDVAAVDWRSRSATAVVPRLQELSLDCKEKAAPELPWHPEDDAEYDDFIYLEGHKWMYYCPYSSAPSHGQALPGSAAAAIAAATQLSSLGLSVLWSKSVPALCTSLQSLRELK